MNLQSQNTDRPTESGPVLQPGSTCWRIEPATKAAFLVDGEAFFHAFCETVGRARHSILVLCWDIDSRVRMVRGRQSKSHPTRLDELLREALDRQPDLHAYVLGWDYHMIYAWERQWLSKWRLGGATHPRLHAQLDKMHPLWASHHQKVIVIDDAVAFCGGLDPTKCRWDTPAHLADDPRRVDPDGNPYRPFHDVQMMVEGPASQALGELARERWFRATGSHIPPPPSSLRSDSWPAHVQPDLEHIRVGIARTEPRRQGRKEVREVERLFVESIRAARRLIYIETQYFTSKAIGEALVARLETADGPEILMVVHPNSDGWMEQQTMDVLRNRLVKRLRQADRRRRLAIYCPHVPGFEKSCITVHSKVMIIDDDFLRIGSANLSNRSMGFDTECDLAIEATDQDRVRDAIAGFRNRLLAEHLGSNPEAVMERFQQESSGIAAVESLRQGDRTLLPFELDESIERNSWLPDAEVIDPDRPFGPDAIVAQVIPQDHRAGAGRQVVAGTVLMVALVALAAAWRWSPLGEWLDVEALTGFLQGFQDMHAAPLIVIVGFVIGGLAVVPVTVLIAVTVLTFGPVWGFIYSFGGMTLSALLTYGLGRALGRQLVDRLASSRLNQLSRRLATKGLLTVIAVRIVPVAPFSIVNIVAGASHIGFRDFLLGTIIGEAPGLIAMAAFFDQVWETVRHPGPASILVLGAVAVAITLGGLGLRKWLSKQTTPSDTVAISSP